MSLTREEIRRQEVAVELLSSIDERLERLATFMELGYLHSRVTQGLGLTAAEEQVYENLRKELGYQ